MASSNLRLHQNSNINIRSLPKSRVATFFFGAVGAGASASRSHISRSLLQSIAAVRSGSAAATAARGAASVVVLAVALHRALVGSFAGRRQHPTPAFSRASRSVAPSLALRRMRCRPSTLAADTWPRQPRHAMLYPWRRDPGPENVCSAIQDEALRRQSSVSINTPCTRLGCKESCAPRCELQTPRSSSPHGQLQQLRNTHPLVLAQAPLGGVRVTLRYFNVPLLP